MQHSTMSLLTLTVALLGLLQLAVAASNRSFPAGFIFGTATASYQVEGAWDEDDKGENIWDHFCHLHPEKFANGDNGDVACDSYHKYKDDVQMLVNLGANYYRFSLSWSRILPDGTIDNVNQKGVAYYKALLKELKANHIEPWVTLYHWDLPQKLQDIGGWPNETIVDYFGDYARLAFNIFGNDVKNWMTFNEAKQTCQQGYGSGAFAPGISSPGQDEYKCTHNVLKAHARAYHIYNEHFRPGQEGRVSMVVDTDWFEPATNSTRDIEAAERKIQFNFGWYANAIYSPEGNYPQVMIDRIAERSKLEGFNESRLPTFTPEEVDYIQGTYDFLALNIYTTSLAAWTEDEPIGSPSWQKDTSVKTWQDPSWEGSASGWLKVVPWGARRVVNWVKTHYNNPEIVITENGFSDDGQLHDDGRINYYREYLSALLDAIYEDDVRLTGYTAWSLMDNFEWLGGYTQKFGLYQVDFTDPDRKRTPKDSVDYFKKVIATKCLVDVCEAS